VPAASTIKLLKEQKKLLDRGFKRRSAGKVRPADAGDEYLNWEFGWKPVLADLRAFARSIKDSHKLLDQIHRDSGQNVRRRYEFPVTSNSSVLQDVPGTSLTPSFDEGLGNCDVWMMGSGPSHFKLTTEYTKKRVFSGCYTYYVPPAEDFVGKARQYETYANMLLGTRVTPEVVWNLAPWSWAADWFTNAGDVISNYSQFGSDGLTMRYGYITEKITCSATATLSCSVNLRGAPNTAIALSETLGSTTTQRRYASPYGFGLTFDGFTPRQQAITVALGLTRGQRN
jgi:hypothetical protein